MIKQVLKSSCFVKRKMRKCKTMKEVENRNEQFEYIAQLKGEFIEKGLPVLSIDTKKKEIIGNFYREGKSYCNQALEVNDHEFIPTRYQISFLIQLKRVIDFTVFLSKFIRDFSSFCSTSSSVLKVVFLKFPASLICLHMHSIGFSSGE